MFDRRFIAEGAAIVAAAILCAGVANLVAARERKVAWAGNYPRALEVTQKSGDATVQPATENALIPIAPPAATETTPAPSTNPAATAATAPTATSKTPAMASTPTVVAVATTPPKPKRVFAPHPDKAYLEITNDDALQLWSDKAIFVDARRTDVFAAGHIAGARSIPVWEADVDDRVKAFFGEVTDQQRPIVIYCSGGNCEDSHMLAEKLWGVGFENVLVYKDGYPGWQKVGGATQ